MAPKAAAAPKTTKVVADHASYVDMITEAILVLKDRNGSSRMALKKYVKSNNKINAVDRMYDSLFNRALKSGVEKGVFEQPKGPSGGTKLAKKQPKPAAVKAAPKAATEKKVATAKPKKAAAVKKVAPAPAPAAAKPKATKAAAKPKAAAAPKKAAAPKATKAAAPKKAAVAKPKKAAAAPAVVEKPSVLSTTKSGRVTKTAAKPAAAKKAVAKKATPKKATPKKTAAAKA